MMDQGQNKDVVPGVFDLTTSHDHSSGMDIGPGKDGLSVADTRYPLPLVSVIVVNYNYAAFLREAVESVVNQTYPFIECVIVDDCSTDDSPAVISRLKGDYEQIKVVVNERNGGQSTSSIAGMANSSGAYVIFLDADDYLYPTCVETHIQAHLALRMPVGFTSVDMVQLLDGRIVTAAAPCFSNFVRSRSGVSDDNVRDLGASEDLPRLSLGKTPIAHLLHYVDPKQAGGWPWSPTSGNCFRRDALHLIINNKNLTSLRSCTDCYLLRGVACLTGSALIDRPLFGYRLHGKNDFVKSANLHRVVPYDAADLKKKSNQATKMLIDHLIDNSSDLIGQLETASYFREALDALDDVHPPITEFGVNYITKALLLNRDRLRSDVGAELYDRWLTHRLLSGLTRAIVLWLKPVRILFAKSIVPMAARSIEKKTRMTDIRLRGGAA